MEIIFERDFFRHTVVTGWNISAAGFHDRHNAVDFPVNAFFPLREYPFVKAAGNQQVGIFLSGADNITAGSSFKRTQIIYIWNESETIPSTGFKRRYCAGPI